MMYNHLSRTIKPKRRIVFRKYLATDQTLNVGLSFAGDQIIHTIIFCKQSDYKLHIIIFRRQSDHWTYSCLSKRSEHNAQSSFTNNQTISAAIFYKYLTSNQTIKARSSFVSDQTVNACSSFVSDQTITYNPLLKAIRLQYTHIIIFRKTIRP